MSEKKAKEEPKKEEAGAAEGAEGAADAPKKSKKKIIIIAVAGLVVIGGLIGGLMAAGVFGGGDEKAATKTEGEAGHGEEGGEGHGEKAEGGHGKEEVVLDEHGKPVKPKPVFFNMPDIIVNLSSPSPRPHFVNLKMTLELKNEASLADVEAQLPRIIDSFNTYLREVRREDLQGSAGTYRLKKELAVRLDKILGEKVVTDILFREIIVQ